MTRMTSIKKIAVLGSGRALKPRIVMETLKMMAIPEETDFCLFSDGEPGICTEYFLHHGLQVVPFENVGLDDSRSRETAVDAKADLLISVGWPHRIPTSFLNVFPARPINCHGSVLPDYRGSRSYMHYWANCEEYFGATIHYISDKLDDGNIIVQGRLKQFPSETPEILHRRTAELCAHLLPLAIILVEQGWQGKRIEAEGRYFYQLKPQEYEEYRKFNETRSPAERKLTPHKHITGSAAQ